MHHEVELVVALKSGGRNIKLDRALDCIYVTGVGIDLTRRDLQIALTRHETAVGDRQGLRRVRAVRPLQPASKIGQSEQRPHRAQGQRKVHDSTAPGTDDLECARGDRQASRNPGRATPRETSS